MEQWVIIESEWIGSSDYEWYPYTPYIPPVVIGSTRGSSKAATIFESKNPPQNYYFESKNPPQNYYFESK